MLWYAEKKLNRLFYLQVFRILYICVLHPSDASNKSFPVWAVLYIASYKERTVRADEMSKRKKTWFETLEILDISFFSFISGKVNCNAKATLSTCYRSTELNGALLIYSSMGSAGTHLDFEKKNRNTGVCSFKDSLHCQWKSLLADFPPSASFWLLNPLLPLPSTGLIF